MLGKRIINTGADACTTDTTQILDAGLTQSEVLYRFEDDVIDTSSSAGKFNKGAIFNGIDTSTGRSKIVTSSLPTYNNYSISFWINSNDLASSADIVMGTSDNYSGAVGFGIYTGSPNSGDLTWAVCDGSSRVNVTASGLSPKQWHHVVITQNTSNNEKKIYVDNTLKTTSTSTINNTNVTYSLIIGGYQTYNNSTLNAKLDQIRVFNKVVSASEVTTLYNETTSTVSTLQVLGDTSCIATYTFEGNANDLSTNYNGTASNVRYDYSGTASNVTYATGKFDKGAVFNGSNSVIDIENMRTVMGNNFAVSLWVKTPSTFASSGYPAVLSMYGYTGSGSAYGWDIEYNNSNKLTFYWVSSSTVGNYIQSSALSTDTWYHVVAQKDSSSANLYINGQLDNDTTYIVGNGMYYNNFNRMTIGAKRLNYGSTSGHISGMVDQVRLFTKQLNAGEINSLYNETTTSAAIATINNPTTIAYYKMADGTDETENYNGTPSNVDFNVQGKYGFAGKFNGTSSYIDLPANLAPAIRNAAAFSISLWFQRNGNQPNSYGGRLIQILNDIYIVINLETNNTVKGLVVTSSTTYPETVTGVVPDNTWNHIVFTGDSNGIKLYLNGSLADSDTWDGTFMTYTNANYKFNRIGYSGSSVAYFKGKIDQIRVFNRAISSSEVTTLYNEIQCANTITAPEDYFNTKLYTGTGASQNITGLNFAPGFVWIKDRSAGNWHNLQDTIRGATKHVYANATNAQDTTSDGLTAFNSDGFTIGGGGGFGNSGNNFVSWNWKAASSNTTNNDGTIASTVRASQESGFSIVKFTSASGSGNTAGHGLSLAPKLVLFKRTDSSGNWWTFTTVIDGSNDYLILNSTDTKVNAAEAAPTDSVITQPTTTSGRDYIAYCFANIDGYQRIGSFIGNGSTSRFVYTGFEPAWVIIKNTTTAYRWYMLDNKRCTTNPNNARLFANDSTAEATNSNILNFNSNGFELITSDAEVNKSGDTMIFMAIAANPDTTVPTKANSFKTKLYTGTGSAQSITGVGFKPDFVWTKTTTAANNHYTFDSVRGVEKEIYTDLNNAEYSQSGSLTSFDSDGFTIGTAGGVSSSFPRVSWNWKGADHDRNLAAINNDGNITSAVSANRAAGFSIVNWTGSTSTSAETVGHGLSSAPELVILKNRDASDSWYVFANGVTSTSQTLKLNTDDAVANTSTMWGAGMTSTVAGIRPGSFASSSSHNVIMYCWHSVSGYSSIGTYTGNGSTTGPSVTVGFRPSWVLIKKTSGSAAWQLFDAIRAGSTTAFPKILYPNLTNAEYDTTGTTYDGMGITTTATTFEVDFSSVWTNLNESGSTYLYMAFK